ncbi:MAG: hypothetical protein JWN95_3863 [Frankiales bacterium]|nr:hypothetical protein [Frankiales bacterium]
MSNLWGPLHASLLLIAATVHVWVPAGWTPLVASLVGTATICGLNSLRDARGWWRWLSFAASVLAAWVEAAVHDLHAPEFYCVPLGVLVLGFGLSAANRKQDLSSWTSWAPGLAIALSPTLVRGLLQPLSWRPIELGVVATGLVLFGARRRLQAPFVLGAVVLASIVLRELGPYALGVPRWSGIGLVGVLLLAVGISWEGRMRDLRWAQQTLAGMR